ncbi:MAG: DUF4349 domain-containing protein [Gemmataceae bacterium]|nr:DUF4349 domain-containing protein [Gemmataceae bacterium]
MSRLFWVLPLLLGCGSYETAFLPGAKVDDMGPAGGERKPENQADDLGRLEQSRKIIYTATLEVIVKDFTEGRKKLLALLEAHKGYIAKSDIGSSTGFKRGGNWTFRIPVANFPAFLEEAAALGETLRNTSDALDVTEEFFDLEARLKNKRVEEERLIDHLKKSTGKLEDILACERELTRVRGEIEQAQGRLQKIDKLTTLTTITVTLTERKDYVPPTAPGLGTRISRVFGDSLEGLKEFGECMIIFLVAITPWSPLMILGFLGLRWTCRKVFAKKKYADPAPLADALQP